MRSKWSKFACSLAVVVFAFWFRFEYQANTVIEYPLRADAGQYYNIGWNIVHHGVASMAHPGEDAPAPDSYRGPGYPLLVALAIFLGGDEKGYAYILIIQAILGALSAGLMIAIARQWLPFSYSLAAGVLVAIWPHLVSLAGNVLTESSLGFFLLLSVYLVTRAVHSGRLHYYILAGLAFAYTTLINPAMLLLPVAITVLLALFRKQYLLVFLCLSLSLPVAWSIRGAMLESGRSTSGRLVENILAGAEPGFSYDFSPATLEARSRVMPAIAEYKDDIWGALGAVADRVTSDPAYYLNWYVLQKPAQLWQWKILGDDDIYVYPVIVTPFHIQPAYRFIISFCSSINIILMVAAFTFMLLLIARSLSRGLRAEDLPLLVVTLVFLYANVLYSVLLPDPRYATPFRPFEIVLAVSLLFMCHRFVQEHRQEQAGKGSREPAKHV